MANNQDPFTRPGVSAIPPASSRDSSTRTGDGDEADRNKHFGNGLSIHSRSCLFRRDFVGQYYFDRDVTGARARAR